MCSAGLLRSATLQNMLIKEYGYNCRNCGTEESYSLIPISEALLLWADEIVFVNKANYNSVRWDLAEMKIDESKIFTLNIPDNYSFNDPKLVEICKQQYKEIVLKEV